jgi:hypothetical protein
MTLIKKHIGLIAGIVAGAIGGYLYYHYIGCMSGSCPITSKPMNSTLYGAIMGALLLSNFQTKKKVSENKTQ